MKPDPHSVVAPPQAVERRHDELVGLGVVDLHQPTAVLHTHGHHVTWSYDLQVPPPHPPASPPHHNRFTALSPGQPG